MKKKILIMLAMIIAQGVYCAPAGLNRDLASVIQALTDIQRTGFEEYFKTINFTDPGTQDSTIAQEEIKKSLETLQLVQEELLEEDTSSNTDYDHLKKLDMYIDLINKNIIDMRFNNPLKFEQHLKPGIISVFLDYINTALTKNHYPFEENQIHNQLTEDEVRELLKNAYEHLKKFPLVLAINTNSDFIQKCSRSYYPAKDLFKNELTQFKNLFTKISNNFNKSANQYIKAIQYLLNIEDFKKDEIVIDELSNEINDYFTKTTDKDQKNNFIKKLKSLSDAYNKAAMPKQNFVEGQQEIIKEIMISQVSNLEDNIDTISSRIEKLNDKTNTVFEKIKELKEEIKSELNERNKSFVEEKNKILRWADSGSAIKLLQSTTSSINSSIKNITGAATNNDAISKYQTYDIEKIRNMTLKEFAKNGYQWPIKEVTESDTNNQQTNLVEKVLDSTLDGTVKTMEFNAELARIKNMNHEDFEEAQTLKRKRRIKNDDDEYDDEDYDESYNQKRSSQRTNRSTRRNYNDEYDDDEYDDQDEQLLRLRKAIAMNKLVQDSGGMTAVLKSQMQGKLFGAMMDKIDSIGTSSSKSRPAKKRSGLRQKNQRYN